MTMLSRRTAILLAILAAACGGRFADDSVRSGDAPTDASTTPTPPADASASASIDGGVVASDDAGADAVPVSFDATNAGTEAGGAADAGNDARTTIFFGPVVSLPVSDVHDFAWVAIGDVDGDRRPDIVVNSAGVLVFRQSSAGTFAAYELFAVEGNGLGLADLDRDARDDAVVVDIRHGGALQVLLAEPGGTLAAPVTYALSSFDGDIRDPGNPHVADFDGDGRLDVVLATDCCQGRQGTVDFFPGRGDGTLGTPTSTDVTDTTVSSVVDIDGDGHLDLVGAHQENSNTVAHIIPYASGGRFGAVRSWRAYGPAAPAFWPTEAQMTVGDVTGDGVLDLVFGVAPSIASNLTVLAQLEGGAFSSAVTYSGADPTKIITTADVTGDGLEDVIALQAGGAAIRSQRSDGTLSPEIILQKPTYNPPMGIAVADLNGDGLNDIVTTELGGLLIFYNEPP